MSKSIASTRYAKNVPSRKMQNAASVLYNGMVAPWNGFAIRGALWYQGEANADQKIAGIDQTDYYATMLQTMIADWRMKKGMGDFAFVAMQLPPSVASGTSVSKQMETAGCRSGWPRLRYCRTLADALIFPAWLSGSIWAQVGLGLRPPAKQKRNVETASASDAPCGVRAAVAAVDGSPARER